MNQETNITKDCRLWSSLHPTGTLCEVLIPRINHLAVTVKGTAFMNKDNEMVVRVTDLNGPVPVRDVRPFMGGN